MFTYCRMHRVASKRDQRKHVEGTPNCNIYTHVTSTTSSIQTTPTTTHPHTTNNYILNILSSLLSHPFTTYLLSAIISRKSFCTPSKAVAAGPLTRQP